MSAAGPVRVAFVQRSLGFGGAERVTVEQIRALASVPSVVDVWLTEDGPRDLESEARAVHPGLSCVGVAPTVASLAWRLLRERYDLVVTCGTRKGLRAVRWVRRVPLGPRPAVVATVHTAYADHVETLRPWAHDIDAFAVAYDFRDRVASALGVPLSRVVVARPLFGDLLREADDASRCEARALRALWGAGRADPKTVVLGFLGRVTENKGIVHVLRMADRLAAAGRDVRLVVVGRVAGPGSRPGTTYREEIDAAVAASPALRGRMHILDAARPSAALYGAFDLFVMCARHEGLPLVLFEAMAAGAPVLATAIGGIRATLTDGVDAALVEKDHDDGLAWTQGDLDRFEARLSRLVDDPDERRRLSVAGRECARALVGTNDFAADFLDAVERALVRRCGAAATGGRVRSGA